MERSLWLESSPVPGALCCSRTPVLSPPPSPGSHPRPQRQGSPTAGMLRQIRSPWQKASPASTGSLLLKEMPALLTSTSRPRTPLSGSREGADALQVVDVQLVEARAQALGLQLLHGRLAPRRVPRREHHVPRELPAKVERDGEADALVGPRSPAPRSCGTTRLRGGLRGAGGRAVGTAKYKWPWTLQPFLTLEKLIRMHLVIPILMGGSASPESS
uniref:Uncharacterized protein n=1 Tax=Equus caballus TaxID=9796 RepID=A0A9L0T2K2_HORSE